MKPILRAVCGVASSVAMICVGWTLTATAGPDGRAIDANHSSLRVHVSKTGFLSAFAHNHEVEAPIESGEVMESGSLSVELRVDARKMRVLDPEASDDTRKQIQKTMHDQVLDADHFTEIRFRSTSVEPKGENHWLVTGNLDLHGETHLLTFEVTRQNGLYKGSANLKQTAFGITPVTVAGGTVKVKDEVKIEFEIALAK